MVGGEFANEPQSLVKVATQPDYAGAVHNGLGELAAGDLAVRDDHRAGDASAGGIGGGAGSSVTG